MTTPSLVGSQVGHIRLVAMLGVGGMGEVYLGYDARLERRVAVKTIRAEHRFEPEMKSRFLREARILSKLEHPAICQVYDLVEGERADFLIFEYVDGKTLKALIAEKGGLEIRQALEIAEKIAGVLAAAHRERIIHRDLKPDNVMVTAGGEVKILDFGISRALREGAGESLAWAPPAAAGPAAASRLGDDEATEGRPEPGGGADRTVRLPAESTALTFDSDLTQRGQVVGTVRYMSPEQAAAEPMTEASDLFSFGLVLQEMLTGRPAYPMTAMAELVAAVGAAQTVPLGGCDAELTALVERLKSRSPPVRPTAVETAERLRWILDQPQREEQRRRRRRLVAGAFAALAAVLLVVSVLAVKASRAAERANREAQRASAEAQRASDQAQNAKAISDFVVTLFTEAAPGRTQGRPVAVRELVDKGAARVGKAFAGKPLDRARFQVTIGELYRELGLYAEAEAQSAAALETRLGQLGEAHLDVARSRHALAVILNEREQWDRAAELYTAALPVFEEKVPESLELAALLNNYAIVLQKQAKFHQALGIFGRTLAIRKKLLSDDAPEVVDSRMNQAVQYHMLGDWAHARQLYEEQLESLRRHGDPNGRTIGLLANLGFALSDLGDLPGAEAYFRQALEQALPSFGENHPNIAKILSGLGPVLTRQGKYPEAGPALDRALAIAQETFGPGSLTACEMLVRRAELDLAEKDLPSAFARLEGARKIVEKASGGTGEEALLTFQAFGRLHEALGDPHAARRDLERAAAIAAAVFGENHPKVAAAKKDLAELERRLSP